MAGVDERDSSPGRGYHHGDLRRALLDAAVAALAESGPGTLSLRELARRAGVSHAAPAHHFGDKTGLLTAVAAEGFRLLDAAMRGAWEQTGDFLEVGVAYVLFAVEHPGHYEVMFSPELHDPSDADLSAAQAAASELLFGPVALLVGADDDVTRVGVAAWSLVHGLATLWHNGVLPAELGEDEGEAARSVLRYLFAPLPGPDVGRGAKSGHD
ncbi:MAG: TetR family transcriptional regulator [Acidimicrobiia bacterium]|nr:TetR family transcriptional regulator [Acidimicrobiia bacterium]